MIIWVKNGRFFMQSFQIFISTSNWKNNNHWKYCLKNYVENERKSAKFCYKIRLLQESRRNRLPSRVSSGEDFWIRDSPVQSGRSGTRTYHTHEVKLRINEINNYKILKKKISDIQYLKKVVLGLSWNIFENFSFSFV